MGHSSPLGGGHLKGHAFLEPQGDYLSNELGLRKKEAVKWFGETNLLFRIIPKDLFDKKRKNPQSSRIGASEQRNSQMKLPSKQ